MAALTAKQNAFVDEYLVDFNATQAAIRAGYSEKTANSVCARLLVNVGISQEIQKRQHDRAERLSLSVETIERSLTDIAFAEPARPPTVSDQIRALELLAKRHGWLERDEVQQGLSDEHRAVIIDAIKRQTD